MEDQQRKEDEANGIEYCACERCGEEIPYDELSKKWYGDEVFYFCEHCG